MDDNPIKARRVFEGSLVEQAVHISAVRGDGDWLISLRFPDDPDAVVLRAPLPPYPDIEVWKQEVQEVVGRLAKVPDSILYGIWREL